MAQSGTTRIIIAFPPGGPADTLARVVANEVGPILGGNVIVENKPGANGALAANEVARAKPDGKAVFLSSTGAIAVNPALYHKLTYKPADFVPVTMLVATPEVLALSAKTGMKSFDDLKVRAKSGNGVTLASSGIGSMPHMAIAQLTRTTGVDVLHVPYSGAAPAINDSIGGQVDGFFGDISGLLQFLKDGRLTPVGVASQERSPALPAVPTFKELGYPDVIAINWYGVFAPAGTPAETVSRLNEAFNKAMQTPKVQEYVKSTGVESFSTTPEAFAKMVSDDSEKWASLIKSEKITVHE
ncbi:tripartite tricarboxylate transporter substrate binding protein [Candidimonas sp. SYP-B2681]|nr:tripartite tricarboxylate transporter substrate binding protein [Candidimonas sp. SYP-B2681]